MTVRPLTLNTPDGHTISGHEFLPVQPNGALVISHGMAEHEGRYHPLARWLAQEHQLLVITYNHRGHGCAASRKGCYADKDGWKKVVSDLSQVIEHAREQAPGLPINLLGHSMGSFIAQGYAQHHGDRLDTLILSATNRINRLQLCSLNLVSRMLALIQGKHRPSPLLNQLTFAQFNRAFRPNRTPCDWLSRDPEQVDLYLSDPLCGFPCSAGLWQDFSAGMLSLAPELWRRDLPVHLFSGTEDAVGEMGKGVRQHFQSIREAGVEQVTLRLFQDGRHEMLNETNRSDVWSYLSGLCRIRSTSDSTCNDIRHDTQSASSSPAQAEGR
ncbi:lysophospholipase [Marinobacter daepoensis]|uniref:Lysophospholipase n=1 Tax=Marinobacter daepoensis TaxID=262077 RepID=A0ABS3BFJ7_9GAMM|nr:alpha/beta fold hydrolase [Marinobacter daepoensis]MBN7770293.1 lysophospholipase [Marinobacter daepoensis]MBY6079739.1 lysophospholipase [Marinobacter daepoensis]